MYVLDVRENQKPQVRSTLWEKLVDIEALASPQQASDLAQVEGKLLDIDEYFQKAIRLHEEAIHDLARIEVRRNFPAPAARLTPIEVRRNFPAPAARLTPPKSIAAIYAESELGL